MVKERSSELILTNPSKIMTAWFVMPTEAMWFLFKIPGLQRLSFPISMWESFTLNFRLIQTTWVWNLAPETLGLGAIWQDAALQNVMAFADAPWSFCLHKPIPPQNHIVSWARGTHLPLHHLCWAGVHVETVRALPEWQGAITAISPFQPSLQMYPKPRVFYVWNLEPGGS